MESKRLSPFGKFFFGLRGYTLKSKRNGKEVYKWEAYDLTRKTASEIINGKCNLLAAYLNK